MWQFLMEYWAQWVCTLIGAGILAALPKIKALWGAVLALLHDRIYTECYRFMELGYITQDGLRNLGYLYKTYHMMERHRHGTLQSRQGPAHPHRITEDFKMDKKVSTATIVRTVCLALALVNQLLSAGGHSVIPIDNETVNQLVTAGVTIVTAIVNWWYNNSFTEAAIEADKTFERVREKNRS